MANAQTVLVWAFLSLYRCQGLAKGFALGISYTVISCILAKLFLICKRWAKVVFSGAAIG
jgi:hypothetical protein